MVKAEIIVAARDEASEKLDKVGRGMDGMAGKAADVSAKFLLIKGAITEAVQMVDKFISGAVSVGQAAARSAALMDEEGVSANDLKDRFRELSESSEGMLHSQEEIAQAWNAIAAEGRGLEGTTNILKAAMTGVAVTGEDLNTTVKNLETSLDVMGMETEDAGRLMDILMNTHKETGTAVNELMSQMQQSGDILQGLGMSTEQAAAMFGVLGNYAKGGGTAIMSALSQIANPMSKASKDFAEMGIQIYDATGKMLPLTQVLTNIGGAGLSSSDMLEYFGVRGAAVMNTALLHLDEISAVAVGNIDSVGEAGQAAGTVWADSSSDIVDAKKSFEDMKNELATGLLPTIGAIMGGLTPLFQLIGKYPGVIYTLVGAYVAWKLATVASTIATHAHTAALVIAKVAKVAAAAAQWLLNIAMYANPLVWIIALIIGLIAVMYLLVKNWDKVTDALGKFGAAAKEKLSAAKEALGDFAAGAKEKLSQFGNMILEGVKKWFSFHEKAYQWGKDLIIEFFNGIKDMLGKAGDWLGGVGDKIKSYIGFSAPPPEGPLKHVPEWGKHMMESFLDAAVEGMRGLEFMLGAKGGSTTSTDYSQDNRNYTNYNTFNLPGMDLRDPLQMRDFARAYQEFIEREVRQ